MQSDVERVLLLVCQLDGETDERRLYREQEMAGLCSAAQLVIVDVVSQKRDRIDRRTLLGKGKIQEAADLAAASDVDLIVVDRELSPSQVRNLEVIMPCRVVDRTQLILDIFAARAKTREGRVQVEIAQLNYLLPRLTGLGIQLSRQGAGIGTRGPGETQLELDRRKIHTRISHLRRQLDQIAKQRVIARQSRNGTPVVALVGYTNAGKTTLQSHWVSDHGETNAASGEDRLFDTLDPTARKVKTKLGHGYIVIDTVGFVENLPHHLVNAFRATLEETQHADVIVLVVDASHEPAIHLQTTRQVLRDLNVLDKPIITFFNKMDQTAYQPAPDAHSVVTLFGSLATGSPQQLYAEVERRLSLDEVRVTVMARPDDHMWRELLRNGRIESANQVEADEWQVIAVTTRREAHRFRDWRQDGSIHDSGY